MKITIIIFQSILLTLFIFNCNLIEGLDTSDDANITVTEFDIQNEFDSGHLEIPMENGTKIISSVEELKQFTERNPQHSYLVEKMTQLAKFRKYCEINNITEENYAEKDLAILSDSSNEQQTRATGWITVYEHTHQNGRIVAMIQHPQPFLRKKNRNKASSLKFNLPLSSAMLCDKSWFRGTKVGVQNLDGKTRLNLTDIGFNDRMESYY